MGLIIRINHEFVDRIDNSVPRVTAWYDEALPSDAKQYPSDRFVNRIHKRMLDSFCCKLKGANALIN